ncbi:hypothetical protein ABT095_35790 [Kitasatospora sp. NPDC002227]|uniref:Rv1733c family protein n=1 Tax=Kitasatospora sp. NPDC002227 TaxID=3154773 RepID=UPI003319470A
MRNRRQRANPVRRTSDRVQWWLARVRLAVLAVTLPAAAVTTGLRSYRGELHSAQTQSATRHPVTARLTTDAPGPTGADSAKVPATAAWTASDGTTRTATVDVWAGESAGTAVSLWVDSHDTPVSAPPNHAQAVTSGWTTAALTAGSVALLCLGLWKGSVHLLNRSRYARWDAEWSQVEPRWSRRLPN